jgi:L-asparaginase II
MAETAVEIFRGTAVESVADANIAVVDSVGRLVAWAGEPEQATFWRSSAKPFQAMPAVVAGMIQTFDLTGQEIAICTASHGGEERHTALVESILAKIGQPPEALQCGIHWPSTESVRQRMQQAGMAPTVIHNNCSGKHVGMLAFAKQLGATVDGYLHPDHPVQTAILKTIRRVTGLAPNAPVTTGIDGCSAPTFYLPLVRMAFAYAQLVDPRGLDFEEAQAAMVVAEAMRVYPELISGEGRLEVRLADATGHRFVAKGGAEAVFCLGVPEHGLGIAIKMTDGNSRTLATTVLATLESLDLLDSSAQRSLDDLLHPVLHNHAGTVVGGMRSVLRLHHSRLAVSKHLFG